MTVYVNDVEHQGKVCLWADTPDEALVAAYGCGATILDRVAHSCSFELFRIIGPQAIEAIAQGAVLTDWLGPAEWCAIRRGDAAFLAVIAKWRATPLNWRTAA